ncbi:MAG: hypothetical protein ACPIOQ_20890 [Promethearchaeia archaeon]
MLQVRRIQGRRPPRVAQLATCLPACDIDPAGVRVQPLQLEETIARPPGVGPGTTGSRSLLAALKDGIFLGESCFLAAASQDDGVSSNHNPPRPATPIASRPTSRPLSTGLPLHRRDR